MQITTKITFVGFLLAVSTLSVSATTASPQMPENCETSGSIEYRLSRITKAIQQRGVQPINSSEIDIDNSITQRFANRGGGRGGFVNRGGGFANRGGGGGFVNRGGGFANRGGGGGFVNRGGGFVNRNSWPNGGAFYNRY